MSNFNWCHGPYCHTNKTQDRIRGIKGYKVLRTKKVKLSSGRSMFGNGGGNVWDYFCNHRCLMDFVAKHTQALANIEPRTSPLETPIEVTKEVRQGYNGNYTQTEINIVDNG
tara:strand:- start:271 stop:606 length:336 start_codon:yes stop_codon:yes gene_type:complete